MLKEVEDASGMVRAMNTATQIQRHTALHEAGHIIVAMTYSWRIRSVTIVPEIVPGSFSHVIYGRVIVEGYPEPHARATCELRLIEQWFIFAFAGVVAERYFSNDPSDQACHDVYNPLGDLGYARPWIEQRARSHGGLVSYEKALHARTLRLLTLRRRDLESIADLLLQERLILEGSPAMESILAVASGWLGVGRGPKM